MWLTLAKGSHDAAAVEQALPELEALVQFTDDLRRRLAGEGIDGLEGTLVLYRRLKAVLDGVSVPELVRARTEVAALERGLGEVARGLEALVSLKRALGA